MIKYSLSTRPKRKQTADHAPQPLRQNIIVNEFRSYVIETAFRSCGIMAHWGDTFSSYSIDHGSFARMNLRLLNITDGGLKYELDLGNAEFAWKKTETKYYKDLLKAVCLRRSTSKDYPGLTPDSVDVVVYCGWYEMLGISSLPSISQSLHS